MEATALAAVVVVVVMEAGTATEMIVISLHILLACLVVFGSATNIVGHKVAKLALFSLNSAPFHLVFYFGYL